MNIKEIETLRNKKWYNKLLIKKDHSIFNIAVFEKKKPHYTRFNYLKILQYKETPERFLALELRNIVESN